VILALMRLGFTHAEAQQMDEADAESWLDSYSTMMRRDGSTAKKFVVGPIKSRKPHK
jgi:hypothetical protein